MASELNVENALRLLVKLLADQHNVEITYEIARKSTEKEKTA